MRALIGVLFCGLLFVPASLDAQRGAAARNDTIEVRSAQLQRELADAQQRLAELRAERARLQAQLETEMAVAAQERARELMMSREADALAELDALLAGAQRDMLAQRERMVALSDAVRRRTGAVLVVLIAVDASAGDRLSAADVNVNGVEVAARAYGDLSAEAFRMGAVDQIYRGDVLPTTHRLRVRATVNGQPAETVLDVSTWEQTTTYVRLTVRGGALDHESWTTEAERP